MPKVARQSAAAFCDDARLGYAASRRLLTAGEALVFDDAYRLAHLPLVSPGHPDIISSVAGKDYVDGRYETPRYSLIVPIDGEALGQAPAFAEFDATMRSTSFAGKIAWDLGRRREPKLHATVVNGLSREQAEPCAEAVRSRLAGVERLDMKISGPFLGRFNTGRIYLPVYPQLIDGDDAFGLIQDACGSNRTRFYVIGYYHFAQPLTDTETAELAAIVEKWHPRTLAVLQTKHVIIHATNDDLALSARSIVDIELTA